MSQSNHTTADRLESYENNEGKVVLHQPGTPTAWYEIATDAVVTLTEWE